MFKEKLYYFIKDLKIKIEIVLKKIGFYRKKGLKTPKKKVEKAEKK